MKHQIIFKAIVGSQAYGMATAASDIDIKGVFVQHPDEILSDKYVNYLEISKDECYFEICKFINLLKVSNPTALELLFSNNDCIQINHPAFELIFKEREKFLSKQCMNSFVQYAKSQIMKATALDKKMNWENNRITKKTPFDFCWVYENGGTKPVEKYLKENNMKPENCGLVALDHFRDTFALYYKENVGYRGISIDDGNAVRLTSIPKKEKALICMHWNKDGYTKFCKDYKEYQHWLEHRNESRYVDTKKSGEKIDSKNMSHCIRLIETAEEIVKYKTINVKRSNANYLLSIRRGEVNLEELVKTAQNKMKAVNNLFEASDLPENVDENFVHELILKVRKNIVW